MGKFDDDWGLHPIDEECTCWREGHDGVRVDCDKHRHEVEPDE